MSVRWWWGFVVLVACGGQSLSRDGGGNGGDGGTGLGSGAGGTAPTGGAGTAVGGAATTGGSSAAVGGATTPTGGSSAPFGGATTSGVAGIGGSGTAGAAGTPGCDPMDARSNGDDCAAIAGFTWDGSMCHPISCGCEGSDCGAVYATIDACDQARAACYTARGVRRDCTKHADCGAAQRACCAPCGMPTADAYIGIRLDSPPPGICGPIGCPDCASWRDPAIYPICIDGQCAVGDLGAAAACMTDTQCVVRTKDCCECMSDTSPPALMAVGAGFDGSPPWCTNVGCPRCAGTPVPATATATCDGLSAHCRLELP
jgi:hypothetical protein